MRLRAWVCLGLIVSFASGGVVSAAPADELIRFEKIGVREGLGKRRINAITQDAAGFLWVGCEYGLFRYDGASFEPYKHDPDDAGSISNSAVTALAAENGGALWIAAANGDINRFDPATGRFRLFNLSVAGPFETLDAPVEGLHIDRSGRLSVLTNSQGILDFDRRAQKFRLVQGVLIGTTPLQETTVLQAFDQTDGSRWLSLQGIGPVLLPANVVAGSGSLFVAKPDYGYGDAVLLRDRADRIWAGAWGDGILRFDPARERFRPTRIIDSARHGERALFITCMLEDASGIIWIGTNGAGLLRHDPETGETSQLRHDPVDEAAISSDAITCLFLDRSGTLWVGSDGGLNKYSHFKYKFTGSDALARRSPEVEKGVTSILEDTSGRLWLGLNGGGLVRHESESQQLVGFPFFSQGFNVEHTVTCIAEMEDGSFIIGTTNLGLMHFDQRRQLFKRLTVPLHVTAILRDRNGVIWFTSYINGLGTWDAARDVVTFWRIGSSPDNKARGFDGTTLVEDPQGNLWIGTDGEGVIRLSSNRKGYREFRHITGYRRSLSDNRILSLLCDRDGAVWIGTRYGLNRGHAGSDEFTAWFEKDGLPDNAISALQEDSQGLLWMSTYNGLASLDRERGTIQSFGPEDGLEVLHFNPGATCRTTAGAILFGGINGFISFSPAELRRNPLPPSVVLTGFRKFGQSQHFDRPIGSLERINLQYHENFFSFEFAALDYTDPGRNSYAYRMEGLDDDWIECGRARTAQYTQVPPGNYTFRVRAANSDGVWNETGAAIQVIVIPPFWMTTEFRIGAIIAIILAVILFIQVRTRKITHQRNLLQKEVDVRKRVEKRLRGHQARLRTLASQLTLAEERERRKIAISLHDHVGHALFLTKLDLTTFGTILDEEGGKNLKSIVERVNDAINVTRELTVEISPPSLYKFGFEAAAESLVGRFGKEQHVATEFSAPSDRIPISDDVAIMLYQSLRELLMNVLKHARATVVRVTIARRKNTMTVKVADNGLGFNIYRFVRTRDDSKGYGLFSIRERMELLGGDMEIASEPGNGTEITIIAPLSRDSETEQP